MILTFYPLFLVIEEHLKKDTVNIKIYNCF